MLYVYILKIRSVWNNKYFEFNGLVDSIRRSNMRMSYNLYIIIWSAVLGTSTTIQMCNRMIATMKSQVKVEIPWTRPPKMRSNDTRKSRFGRWFNNKINIGSALFKSQKWTCELTETRLVYHSVKRCTDGKKDWKITIKKIRYSATSLLHGSTNSKGVF